MNELIEKTINPPGINKKNRRSLFSTISDVADIVKKDALKAFNAHFPYLADTQKLEEHGKALIIPHLLDDNEKEYRDRVSTASFFLMRAGERAYIIEQLDSHFGDRYIVSDEFLEVYVKVRDLADTDRHWLLQFLDELINPNVKLSVSEWFHLIDKVTMRDRITISTKMGLHDSFNAGVVKLNGRVKLDGHTINATEKVHPKLDGRWKLDGIITLSGSAINLPATSFVRLPIKLGRGILDKLTIKIKTEQHDEYKARIKLNGAIKMDGCEKLSGFGHINDKFRIGMRYCHKLNGQYQLNGIIKLNSGILLPV
jgi:hypothetical protein